MKSFLKKLRFGLGSLRLLLFFLIVLIGVVPVIASIVIMLNIYESRQINNVINSISGQALMLNGRIVSGGYLNGDEDGDLILGISELDNVYNGRIIVADKSMRIVKDTYNIYDDRILIWQDAIKSLNGETVSNFDRENHLITVTVPIISNQGKNNEKIIGVMAILRNTDTIEQDIAHYKYISLMIVLVSLLLLVFLGILLPYQIAKPLTMLDKQIKNLVLGKEFSNVKGYSEVSLISRDIDEYTQKSRRLNLARDEFVSNVSHELKTPLTSMKILADSLTSSEDAPVEFYREFMEDITSEIDRETEIINDLLSIVRLERSGDNLDISAVNINECMERIMKQLRPMAEIRDISLVLETFRPITVDIDEVKFSQALMNLIENAIKYNNDGGFVHVSINSDHHYCFINIDDNGMGIEEDDLERIFERFYRADKSHSKEIEGTGLGLSITKTIILQHHGEIKVSSIVGEGTTFSIRMPLTYVAGNRS